MNNIIIEETPFIPNLEKIRKASNLMEMKYDLNIPKIIIIKYLTGLKRKSRG